MGVLFLSRRTTPLPEFRVTQVELIPASSPRLKGKTIVPDTPSNKPDLPVETERYASKDQAVTREMVKRGESETLQKVAKAGSQEKAVKASSAENKPQKSLKKTTQNQLPRPQTKKSRPGSHHADIRPKLDLGDLSFDTSTFAREQMKKPAGKSSRAIQQKGATSSSIPFSRSAGTGARFVDPSTGISNHLPDLPDGDLTMLNAKAHKYAVFIQRVALRVFASLRRTGWTTLPMQSINAIQREAIVLVSMSKEGKILQIEISQVSGSAPFDKSLELAAQSASDPNPPASAADASGTITLEFHAQTWARIEPGARNGMRERRWLYLGTGLL
jgi:TonB family protein